MSAGAVSGPLAPGAVPPQVRREGVDAVKGFRAALAFESLLLKQVLSQALPETPGLGGGEGEEESAADPRLAALPETVADAVVSAGGLGLAGELYHSFEAGR